MAFQLFRYLARIWERAQRAKESKLPLVIPVVFYHGANRWNISEQFQALFEFNENTQNWRRFIPNFEFHLFDLSVLPDQNLQGRPLLRAILLLFKHIKKADLEARVFEIFRLAFAEGKSDRRTLDALKVIVRYLRLSKRLSANAVKENFDKAMNAQNFYPEVRTFIDDWIDEGLAKGMRQGLEKGMQQGLQQGLKRGRTETLNDLNLRLLKKKFGKITKKNEKRIRRLSLQNLESLSEAILDFVADKELNLWLDEKAQEPKEPLALN